MTDYFVRLSGSDSNAGTSAGAAWRTIGKALGASGIASGDQVYIGAGIYRESVTCNLTSPTATTNVIGDVTGEFTGDVGEVIWTGYTNGWHNTPGNSPLILNGRDYLSFSNLSLIAGAGGNCVHASTATPSNITLTNCMMQAYGAIPINILAGFGVALNWVIDRCFIAAMNGQNSIVMTHTTGTGADWDVNVQVRDSIIFTNGGSGVQVTNSGTSANEGGGVYLERCTIFAATGFLASSTRNSLTYPSTVKDCLIFAGTGMSSGESGSLLDSGGNIMTGGVTNVTLHGTTRTSTHDFPAPVMSFGHEWMWGVQPRRAFAPMFVEAISRGLIGSASTDMEGRARPEGSGRFIDSGTATAGAATTLTDSGKSWATNEHVGRRVVTTGGTGAGQYKHISSNTATVLTIGGSAGNWATNPSTDTTYVIYEGAPATTGNASSGSASTITDNTAAWSTNQWAGYTVEITAGTGSGQTATIVSNTSQAITRSGTWSTNPDTTSDYAVYWPGASLSSALANPGALEFHDTAQKETTTTDAGSVGIVLNGPASHEFRIPVDAASTTISIKMRYDADHGTTNKPQAILVANGEIGVSAETKTMTSAADTWETLTFSAFTPDAAGVVTVRLVSRSDKPWGRCYADTWTVV